MGGIDQDLLQGIWKGVGGMGKWQLQQRGDGDGSQGCHSGRQTCCLLRAVMRSVRSEWHAGCGFGLNSEGESRDVFSGTYSSRETRVRGGEV